MSTKFGDTIQDYRVLNLLGGGGFGKVYRAIGKNGVEVAIKMINKGDVMARSKIARVKCEVEIHNRLLHPAILDVYNFFEDSDYIYLVLEICHNGSLEEFLKSRKLKESEARKIFHQVVDGLLYLHSHKILHRDLNLSNILVTKDLKIKIADFGLATEVKTEQKQFTMCGTPNYMAPEIARRSSHGLESDVWSLGCILYALLVGHPPFQTRTVRNTLHRVVKGTFQVPKDVSPAAADLISSMLRTDPRERLRLDQILHHPFVQDPASSTATTLSGRLQPWVDSGLCLSTSTPSTKTSPTSLKSAPPVGSKIRTPGLIESRPVTKVCPLNATRLKPMQHNTCNVHISISLSRTVVLKFRRRLPSQSHQSSLATPRTVSGSMEGGTGDHFREIIDISTNGMEVKVFRPMKSSTSAHKMSELFEGFYTHASYTYHALPSRYWKKYNYASSYVDMVRSRTPKVITYSEEAKCILMENGPNANYEALFYSGAKVKISGSDIHCIEPGGVNHTVKEASKVPQAMRSYFEHAQKYLQVVKRVEASLDWDSEDQCFPIICKKRPRKLSRKSQPASEASKPSSDKASSILHPSSSENAPPVFKAPVGKVRSVPTAAGSENALPMFSRPSTDRVSPTHNPLAAKPSSILRRVYVDGIGWAIQLSSGEVEVCCNDGSQLKLDPVSNLSFLIVKDPWGNISKYGKKDRETAAVKLKLEVVTLAVQALSSSV